MNCNVIYVKIIAVSISAHLAFYFTTLNTIAHCCLPQKQNFILKLLFNLFAMLASKFYGTK